MQVLLILYLKYASPFLFFSKSMQVPFPLQQRVCTSNYLFYLTLPTLLSATLFTVQYLITVDPSLAPTSICCLAYSAVPIICNYCSTNEYPLPILWLCTVQLPITIARSAPMSICCLVYSTVPTVITIAPLSHICCL